MSKHPPNVWEDCDVLGLLAFPGNSVFIVCSGDKKVQFIGTSELLWEGGGGGSSFHEEKDVVSMGGEQSP